MEKETSKPMPPKDEETKSDKPADNNVVTETKSSGNNKALIIVLVVIGAFVVLGILGTVLSGVIFKKGAEKFVESVSNTNITKNSDGSTTVESKDGSTSVTSSVEQKLPSDFPSTIPLYANQKITSSYKQKTTSGNYWQVITETSDSVSKVVSSVKDAYSKSPWMSDGEVENDGTYSFVYSKTGYKVTVLISKSSDMKMTNLTYTVTEEPTTE